MASKRQFDVGIPSSLRCTTPELTDRHKRFDNKLGSLQSGGESFRIDLGPSLSKKTYYLY